MIKRLAFNQLHKDFQQVNQTTNEKFKKNINNDENDNRIINVNDDDEMNIIKERLLLVNEQNVKQFQIINQR